MTLSMFRQGLEDVEVVVIVIPSTITTNSVPDSRFILDETRVSSMDGVLDRYIKREMAEIPRQQRELGITTCFSTSHSNCSRSIYFLFEFPHQPCPRVSV